MGDAPGISRVRRDALTPSVTCPLCQGLFREATAISLCLHTFCRECIMEKINDEDEDVDCCPVCNIDLGCDPEEKLRPDHNLQDIRNKLFPINKRKVDSPKVPTTLPPKRKQRSLSSLVCDTPSVAMQTSLTGKRTKARRRAAASRATSTGNNGTMKSPTKSEGRDQKTGKSSAPPSTKVATTAKKTESRDQKKIEKTSAQQLTKAATAANKKQQNTDVEVSSKPSSEDRKNATTADKEELQKPSNLLAYASSTTKEPRSTPKVHSVTEEQIKKKERVAYASSTIKAPRSTPKIHSVTEEQIKKKEGEVPVKKDETENKVVIPGTRLGEHSNEPIVKEEDIGSSSEPEPSTDKARTEDSSNQGMSGSASTFHDPITTPVWFSLVSSPNKHGGPQLAQLSKIYLKIKDGSMQISLVQRYIAEKLDLDEDEVEITFHDQPLCPSTTLHGLLEMWSRRESEGRAWALVGQPANEFVMALGYRRRHRPYLVPRILAAAPPDEPRVLAAPPGEPCEGDCTTVEAASK